MQLAIVAAPLFTDGLVLQRVEARLRYIELVQHGKRKRQDHEVGDHVARTGGCLEGECVPPVRRFLDPGQTLAHLDDVPAQVAGHGLRQLLIAAADVELLVRLAEDRQRVRIGLEPEQEDQVERRLLGRIGAVLDHVGDVEERPERRAMSTGNTLLDVLIDAHPIQRPPRRCVRVERGGETGGFRVGGDSVRHDQEIPIRLALRVVPPKKW